MSMLGRPTMNGSMHQLSPFMLGNKTQEIASFGRKALHSGVNFGEKASSIGHTILDNAFVEGLGLALAPEIYVPAKVGLETFDQGLKYTKMADKAINPQK